MSICQIRSPACCERAYYYEFAALSILKCDRIRARVTVEVVEVTGTAFPRTTVIETKDTKRRIKRRVWPPIVSSLWM